MKTRPHRRRPRGKMFKVTLPAGDVTIGLSNLGRDISGQVKLYNATGSQIASAYDATQGSSVSLKHTSDGRRSR